MFYFWAQDPGCCLWLKGRHLKKFGKGTQGNATYQISSYEPTGSKEEIIWVLGNATYQISSYEQSGSEEEEFWIFLCNF